MERSTQKQKTLLWKKQQKRLKVQKPVRKKLKGLLSYREQIDTTEHDIKVGISDDAVV